MGHFRRPLQPSAGIDWDPELHLRVDEAIGSDQIFQRVGMQRPRVRQVAQVAFEERQPTRDVDGLQHDDRARAEHALRLIEKSEQVGRFEVLDHLRGNQAAERPVGL